ncbi:MAG: type II toxin-antitoxin system VapB family antitoxin [Nitrospinae bacterium]|nr:type II toxin-antitoxin system VapB family antitoxin [Nitrospinota bacterium]
MRTTLTIDESTLKEISLLTQTKNRSEAVRKALSEYIIQRKREKVLALRGKVEIEDNWQSLRKMEINSK